MNADTMRERLHDYIEQVNERKLQGLYLLIEEELPDQSSVILSTQEMALLDEDMELYDKGVGESYSWEEAKVIIRSKKVG